jgi:hypothetical protein
MFSHFLKLIKFLLTVLTNTMIVMLTEQVWLKVLYMVWIGNVQSLLEIDIMPAHSFNKYDDCHVD